MDLRIFEKKFPDLYAALEQMSEMGGAQWCMSCHLEMDFRRCQVQTLLGTNVPGTSTVMKVCGVLHE